MEWIQRQEGEEYLRASAYIDTTNPKVGIIAQYCMERAINAINTGDKDAIPEPEAETARQAFLLVRDEIKHSHDVNSEAVPFRASDVLTQKEGLCYAKANLLCAILRQCGIPAGIGYQYLRLDGTENTPLVLHAVNFIHLDYAGGWMRVDARGNKTIEGGECVNALFSIGQEKMAFKVDPEIGECDLPFIYASHDRTVIAKYTRYDNLSQLWADLPDKLSGKE